MSLKHCERCAEQVDTDYDTETLYEGLCADCAYKSRRYHPHNEEEG